MYNSGVAIHKNERGNGGIDAFVNGAVTLCVTLYIRLCNKGITIVSVLLFEHGQCRRMCTSCSAITSDHSRIVGQCYHMEGVRCSVIMILAIHARGKGKEGKESVCR